MGKRPASLAFGEIKKNNNNVDAIGAFANPKPTITYPQDVWSVVTISGLSGTLRPPNEPTLEALATDGAGSRGIYAYSFGDVHVAASEQEMFFSAQIPYGYKEGTDFYPHIHIARTTAPTGTQYVKWGLEYGWYNWGESITNTTIIYVKSVVPTDNKLDISFFPTIKGFGKDISGLLLMRLFRNSSDTTNDTYTGDMFMLELDIQYQADSLGTLDRYKKEV